MFTQNEPTTLPLLLRTGPHLWAKCHANFSAISSSCQLAPPEVGKFCTTLHLRLSVGGADWAIGRCDIAETCCCCTQAPISGQGVMQISALSLLPAAN